MIEDDELRELFGTESEEHLQMLDDGLLRLETNPNDKSTLEEVFRAAHSLKGTARMLGVSGVETIAHHMEDELGSVRRGRSVLTSSHIDRYSVGLSAMRKLVQEATSDTRADVDLSLVLGQLSGEIPLQRPLIETALPSLPPIPAPILPEETLLAVPVEAPQLETELARIESTAVESTAIESTTVESSPLILESAMEMEVAPDGEALEMADDARRDDFKIQTMRVPPAKLDALMTLASELTVTSTRVIRGLSAFEEIGALWEEWNKDMASQRPSGQLSDHGKGDTAKQLAAFHAREQHRLARLKTLWEQLKDTTYQDVTRLNFVADELEEGIRNVRLLPLSQIFNLFPRLVRDLARELGKEVYFGIEGGETTVDKRILEEMRDPLMHMLRNAVDHGIESPQERERAGKSRVATIRLRAYQSANNVMIELHDDGRGLDTAAIKNIALKRRLHSEEELTAMSREQLHLLIFAPGFSTNTMVTDVSGRGVGMDVARINIERLKGSIRVQSEQGLGTTFTIRLPSTLATTRVLLVTVAGRPYAIPVEWVQTIVRVTRSQIFSIEGRQTIVLDGGALPIARLSSLLELPSATPSEAEIYVVLEVGAERFAVQVDGLIDEQEVMLKPLGALLKRVRNVSGVTILGAGEICMVLNAHDLARAALHLAPRVAALPPFEEDSEDTQRKVILLAEDSITTRTQEKRILESAGYEVVTAVDGADAFAKLPTREFDAVISDVEMPNMDGLTLASRIRENPSYDELPIILVTSLASDDDKRRGVEVGANAYITKGTFEQQVLIDTLRRLV
jgi:two-component system chemotaxis sensor kinase CheA